ncbi:hypothetical protein PJ311_11470 [Bacillus sp. CLL-7-23]|uniref:Uncharacterized protein n=1 Tax=Bacillus changyiensis TaxID=3004103 RepID=A0ABT4X4L0_9BACI|nr:hypothetical protein [Bacillus changyiensis]MDA7027229.1 hypothetical protein [Bacillus changyiensis]
MMILLYQKGWDRSAVLAKDPLSGGFLSQIILDEEKLIDQGDF